MSNCEDIEKPEEADGIEEEHWFFCSRCKKAVRSRYAYISYHQENCDGELFVLPFFVEKVSVNILPEEIPAMYISQNSNGDMR